MEKILNEYFPSRENHLKIFSRKTTPYRTSVSKTLVEEWTTWMSSVKKIPFEDILQRVFLKVFCWGNKNCMSSVQVHLKGENHFNIFCREETIWKSPFWGNFYRGPLQTFSNEELFRRFSKSSHQSLMKRRHIEAFYEICL